ncbi:MAG: hypothetical protein ACI3XA_05295 [Clostridia bacterium]
MAFLDELKDMATDAAQVASKKVNDVYAVTKVKMDISENKSKIRALYRELGEMVYKASKGEVEEDSNAIEDKIAEISLVMDALEELNEAERHIKKVKVCPTCKEQIDEKSAYCPRCGNEV